MFISFSPSWCVWRLLFNVRYVIYFSKKKSLHPSTTWCGYDLWLVRKRAIETSRFLPAISWGWPCAGFFPLFPEGGPDLPRVALTSPVRSLRRLDSQQINHQISKNFLMWLFSYKLLFNEGKSIYCIFKTRYFPIILYGAFLLMQSKNTKDTRFR